MKRFKILSSGILLLGLLTYWLYTYKQPQTMNLQFEVCFVLLNRFK